MEALKIVGLCKRFGDKVVLDGLNLSIPEKSIFGFVGRNGAGKTTTMKAILGLLKVDEGEIFVMGEKVRFGQTPTNRYIGYLPDVPEFYSFLNAKEYLSLCGQSLNMEKSEIEKRSQELLDLVGLSGENHRIKGFSRGMKQRLGIAQALLYRPKLLICDEPTSALDPIGRKEILDILQMVKSQTTVFFSTHILSDVERICTEVALLSDGRIQMQGPAKEIKKVNKTKRFTVETVEENGAKALKNAFDYCQLIESEKLLFLGGEEQTYEVLGFIKENHIPIRKIEREEPSLESVFMEVMKK